VRIKIADINNKKMRFFSIFIIETKYKKGIYEKNTRAIHAINVIALFKKIIFFDLKSIMLND